MNIQYENKKTVQDILSTSYSGFNQPLDGKILNKLIFGENLSILKALADKYQSKIDLVYIDPPFATNKKFTLTDDKANSVSNSLNGRLAYEDTLTGPEFLEFLRERLILIRELMSENSSIYLHIDYKIGHYVKMVMDEVFGASNFINDITRIKCSPKNFKRKAYGNVKDLILFYSKTKKYIWNHPQDALTKDDIKKRFNKTSHDGRKYTTIPLHAPGETINGATGKKWKGIFPPKGRHWRSSPDVLDRLDKEGLVEWSKNGVPRKIIFADEMTGKKKQDIWLYKDGQNPRYPTEKNSDMLEMIVCASSDPGSIVLDCFCGSGATLIASQKNGRSWIGVDRSEEAIKVTKESIELLNDDFKFQFIEEKKISKKIES
jgi:adenine-specific DNA-methyltransferase